MRKSRNASWLVIRALWLILTLAFDFTKGSYAQTKPEDRLTVAYSFSNYQAAPLWLAQDEKLFEAQGLDVKMVYIPSGSLAVQSLISGDLDLAYTSGASVMSAVLAGYPLRIISGVVNYYPNAFFSTPDVGSPKALRGKKIAVTRVGSSSYFSTIDLLGKWGIKEGEYTIVQLGTTQARLAALLTSQIQGTTLSAPESVIAKEAGMRVLGSFREIQRLGVTILHIGIAGSTATLSKKARAVERFLDAFVQGIALMYTQREKTIQTLKRHTKIYEMKFLEETYAEHVVIDRLPFPKEEALSATLSLLSRNNPKALSAKSKDFIDLTFLKKLEEEGLFGRLWGRRK